MGSRPSSRPPFQLLPLAVAACAALSVVSMPTVAASPLMTRNAVNAAVNDMQASGYYIFATLLELVRDKLPGDATTTFLMPSDRHLSRVEVPADKLVEFIRKHSIPSALPYSLLRALPTGTGIPTNYFDYILKVVNFDITKELWINGNRIIAPDVCGGAKIACHGMLGVIDWESDLLLPDDVYLTASDGNGGADAPSPEGANDPEAGQMDKKI